MQNTLWCHLITVAHILFLYNGDVRNRSKIYQRGVRFHLNYLIFPIERNYMFSFHISYLYLYIIMANSLIQILFIIQFLQFLLIAVECLRNRRCYTNGFTLTFCTLPSPTRFFYVHSTPKYEL